MTNRFPNALLASIALHGAAVVLIVALTWLAAMRTDKPMPFFELVAGAGDNYTATEAPALGTAEGTAPQPVQAAEPPAAVVITAAQPPPAPKEVDLTKNLQKAAAKSEKKVVDKNKADDAKAAKEEAAKLAKMSKEEFDRQNKGKTTPAPAQKTNVPKVDTKNLGIPTGVARGSTANNKGGAGGKAMTSPGGGEVEGYTALLKGKLHDALIDQSPPGLSDTLVATASMRVLADGTLSSGTITKTSGNPEFDKAVLDAIRLTKMPARPSGFETGTVILDFKARDKND